MSRLRDWFRFRLGRLMAAIALGTVIAQVGVWCWHSARDGREALRHERQEQFYRSMAVRLEAQSRYLSQRAEAERAQPAQLVPVSTGGQVMVTEDVEEAVRGCDVLLTDVERAVEVLHTYVTNRKFRLGDVVQRLRIVLDMECGVDHPGPHWSKPVRSGHCPDTEGRQQ